MSQEKSAVQDGSKLQRLADLFKLFGDTTRIRILWALTAAEISVGDLANQLSMTQSAVSHQLRILKQANLIRARREGKAVYYSLADDHVRTILAMGSEHIEERSETSADGFLYGGKE